MNTAVRQPYAKGVRRTEEILSATREMLIHEGAEALTMRRVAAKLDMSLSNLQHYFTTKETLINALVDAQYEDYVAGLDERVEPGQTPEEQLGAFAQYISDDYQTDEGSILIWELWAFTGRNAYVADTVNKAHESERRIVRKIIGQISPNDSKSQLETKATVITSMFEGVGLFVAPGRPQAKSRKAVTEQLKAAAIAIARA
ncbi:MAG: TetR/AcrR family transcriptional regulator [Rhodobiaceae bacterium]|nr:transcriptional regulator BetI [Rhodobiaceae bacterium]MCR9240599.1 TetR/AcrR family transcriptional regulator [Rhodobiaceae bacterium]